MNKNEIINKVTRVFNKATLKLKKHSPEILVVSGAVGTVTSAVIACKATTKVHDIVESSKEDIHNLHLVAAAAGLREMEDPTEEDKAKIELFASRQDVKEYSKEDLKKDTTIIYAQTAMKFVKLYGPAVILGALSITGILAGHNITRKRNLALAAAYARAICKALPVAS